MSSAIFAVILAATSSVAPAREVGSVHLVVEGCKTNDGKVHIALLDSKESYGGAHAESFRSVSASVSAGVAEWRFEDLPFGEYAIQVYHDENGNGRLDNNFLGIPKEPYGFSNNARGRFGPPKYDKIKFEFRVDPTRIVIRVK